MRKAIFLDRDGVIIKEHGNYSFIPQHIQYVPGIEAFLSQMQKDGFLLIVITNQGGIAKGFYGHEHVYSLHQTINDHLKLYDVSITDWFYCPHHDTISYCLCRKPGPLMLEKAIARYGIDPHQSYMIGDKSSDAAASKSAHVNPLLVASNSDLYRNWPF